MQQDIIIRQATKSDVVRLNKLYNTYALTELVYQKLVEEDFSRLFFKGNGESNIITLVANSPDGLVGFASGCLAIAEGRAVGYITFILVDKAFREQGTGGRLLTQLEENIRDRARGLYPLESLNISFRNPNKLPWILPRTNRREHFLAPGVDVTSYAHIFFKNLGYFEETFENTYYRELGNFSIPHSITKNIDDLSHQDITIEDGDKDVHFGFQLLFKDLGNKAWEKEVSAAIESSDGGRVIVAALGTRPVGFAGPISISLDKRGVFTGIGVRSDFRQKKIGTTLFYLLCQSFKDAGAEYMTLFTSNCSKASTIYEGAGFKVAKVWATMKKK